MKQNKQKIIKISIMMFIILFIILIFLINNFNNQQLEIENNLKIFNNLNGCLECGDTLIKCPNGDYELNNAKNYTVKYVCGRIISKTKPVSNSYYPFNFTLSEINISYINNENN